VQSVVDTFDGKDDIASVYIRLDDNKLFVSDGQLSSSDYQQARIKVNVV